MSNNPIAIQMYTLRDAVAADYAGTLRAVAELGYGAVELTTLGKFSAAELRRELDTLGLRASGMHVGLNRLENELDTVLAELRTLGAPYAICPFLPPDRRRNAEDYRMLARLLDDIGQECKDQGIQLCYHNHAFEYERFDGKTGMEILFDEADSDLVKFELDAYWVTYAGLDPLAEIRKMAGRIPLLHVKDMTAPPARSFAEVGHGILDIPAILAAAEEAGVEWYVVEQDRCERPPLESVGMSLSYLRSLGRA